MLLQGGAPEQSQSDEGPPVVDEETIDCEVRCSVKSLFTYRIGLWECCLVSSLTVDIV